MKPHHSFKGWMILLGWDCCIIWIVGTCNITWLSRIEHQTRWLVQPRRAPGINLSRQVSRSLQFRSMGAFSPKITVHAGGAHQLFRLRWQFVRSGHENLPQRATLTHHPLPPSQLRVCVRGGVSCCEHSLLGRDFILGSLAQPSCKLRPFPFCSYFFFSRACQALELLLETDGWLDCVSRNNKECAVKTMKFWGVVINL